MSKSARAQIAVINTKIAALQALLPALQLAAASEVDLDSVKAGAVVTIERGRGETKQTITGAVVLGVANPEKGGAQVKVQYGEGFDANIVTVPLNAVKAVTTPVAPVGDVLQGGEAPASAE